MTRETQQKLFNYFAENHGITLIESEMQEVENILKPRFDFSKIEVSTHLFKNLVTEACIEFGKWYSGMDGIKVRNAYKRFRREVYLGIRDDAKLCDCGKSHIMHEELDNICDNCEKPLNRTK